MDFRIIVRYSYSPNWLRVPQAERFEIEQREMLPLISRYADTLRVRFFNSGLSTTEASGFMIIETQDLKAYYYFIEGVRDSSFIADERITIDRFDIGIEDGFIGYENDSTSTKAEG